MPHEFKVTHRVEWTETDAAGIIHFASYFRYMEVTEHAFFRSLGYSISSKSEGSFGKTGVGWPRVHVSCDFTHPLVFEDEVEAHLLVREKKRKSLTYEFIFRRVRPEPALEVARGKLTVVCIRRDEHGKMTAVPIPDSIANQIEVAPISPNG